MATLGEVCLEDGTGIQTGPFGSQLHAADYVDEGVPSIMPKNIGDNRIDIDGMSKITLKDAQRLRRYLVAEGDIVYSRRGDVEKRALIKRSQIGWLCGTGCLRVRVHPDMVDPKYASYCLGHPTVRQWVVRHAHGATMPNLNTSILSRCPFVVPPMPEQRAIASILGVLDDKIELNYRMNETLEAIARALFKSWFVDFDPVRAKKVGHLTGLSGHLTKLFPSSLDDRGNPMGWEPKPISEFAQVHYGAPFASKRFNTNKVGVPLIRIRDLATHEPGVSTEQVHQKGHLIEPGDIVVGMDGEFRLHIWKGPKAWLNQRVCHFEANRGVPRGFLAGALRAPLAFFERGKVGTTVIHLGKSDIDTIEVLHPGRALLKAFGEMTEPLLDQSVTNALQSRTLAQTRDLLLPKLISGELRLPDAERIAATVV